MKVFCREHLPLPNLKEYWKLVFDNQNLTNYFPNQWLNYNAEILVIGLFNTLQFELHVQVLCLQERAVQHVQDSILDIHLSYDKIVRGKDWLVIKIRWSMVENFVNYSLQQILFVALHRSRPRLLTLLQSLFSFT